MITTIHGLCAHPSRARARVGHRILVSGCRKKQNQKSCGIKRSIACSKIFRMKANTPLKRLSTGIPKRNLLLVANRTMLLTKLWEKRLLCHKGLSLVLLQAEFDHQRSLRRMIEVAPDYERFARSLGEGANKAILNNVDGLQAAIAEAHHYLEQFDSRRPTFQTRKFVLTILMCCFRFLSSKLRAVR